MTTPPMDRAALTERIAALRYAVQADRQCLLAVEGVLFEHRRRLLDAEAALKALPPPSRDNLS